MAVAFKALEPKKYPKKLLSETKETKYWKRFEKVYESTEKASVNIIACENERNYFAVAGGDIVQIYDSNKQKIKGKIEKFKSGAVTSVAFREDGKLLAVGETNGKFHIIEAKKRSILRTFRQHKEAVHAVRFLGKSAYIASGSDDLTLKFFDISTNSMVRNFVGLHDDFIRSIRVFSENEKLLLVGSYDKTVSLIDLRILEQKAVQTFSHEFPVEDLDIFADDNRFVSVAGTTTTIWDVRQSRSLGSSVNNLKTLTSVKVSSQGQRIITSSLDQHLKVLDPENFTVHYQTKYPSSIMSFNITKNETFMAVGLNTGEYEIKCRRRTDEEAKAIEEEDRKDIPLPQLEGKSKRVIKNFRFFYRGIYETPTAYDQQLETQKKQKLQNFDRYLKKFQYKRALDAALKMNNANVTIGLIEELVQRDAVDIALRNCSQDELDKLFEFLLYNLQDPKFSTILIPVSERVLDIYGGQVLEDAHLKNKFQELSELLEKILQEKDLMMNLLGKLELILDSNLLQNE